MEHGAWAPCIWNRSRVGSFARQRQLALGVRDPDDPEIKGAGHFSRPDHQHLFVIETVEEAAMMVDQGDIASGPEKIGYIDIVTDVITNNLIM